MIVLFTDFGRHGPYTGQMQAVLHRMAPGVPVVDLIADAPAFEPVLAGHLLAALADPVTFPEAVFLSVVDPGVGSDRLPLVLEADGRWYVGPDNGLLAVTAKRATDVRWHGVRWRPERLTSTFHGRDLFAPVAAALARGDRTPLGPTPARPLGLDGPDDLDRIVFIDDFGNAMTGRRASTVDDDAVLSIAGRTLTRARTFSDREAGETFWFRNAHGLVEIAANQGSAAAALGIRVGNDIAWNEGETAPRVAPTT